MADFKLELCHFYLQKWLLMIKRHLFNKSIPESFICLIELGLRLFKVGLHFSGFLSHGSPDYIFLRIAAFN